MEPSWLFDVFITGAVAEEDLADEVVTSDDKKEEALLEEAEEVEILCISDNSPRSLGSEAASLSLNLCRFVEEGIAVSHGTLVLLSSGARIILRRESMPLVCSSVDCCGQKE